MSDARTYEAPEITLGWRLRMAMEKAGIKAETMAEHFEVHRATIGRWLHDTGRRPKRHELKLWAELCAVPYEWLAGALFQDPTVEAEPVPHPMRRATDIKPDSPKSSGQYTAASLACQVRSAHDLLLATT